MPIHEFRESISVQDGVSLADDSYALYQKRISLRTGDRHTVNFIDFYDDSQVSPAMAAPSGWQFFVSKYPVIPTNMILAETFDNAGPPASDPNVLFKASSIRPGSSTYYQIDDEFPNQFLGSSPTFTFYTDHLYLTLIMYNEADSGQVIVDPQMSVYMAIDSVDVNSVEFSMGYYKEYQDAQLIQVLSGGVQMQSTPLLQAGYNFPMWLAGGIRPEKMLRADALADWWHNLDGNFAEKTQTVTNLREYYNLAKTMVTFDAAFGGPATDPKGAVPDWIRVNALPSVISGPELAEFPIQIFPDSTQIAAGVAPLQIMT
tara:strand:- start:472 stop:1419 length:948 start_codon:yes stop_codon:yes gene_type:complete